MSTNPLQKLTKFNQSIWLDFIRRDYLIDGKLESLINDDKVKGVTSNPAIFKKAFASGDIYESAIRAKALQGMDAEQIYQSLAIEDIQFATDLFRPVYDETNGGDGFVSLEVSPNLAHDTESTIKEARDLWKRVDRPNVMIKVPGTKEGLPAIEQLISEGININVTLLFGLERYEKVTQAYISGLEKRKKAGESIEGIASVASFFLSRIDVLVDPMIEKYMEGSDEKAKIAQKAHGQVAVASAKKAYQIYKDAFSADRFEKLKNEGADSQRVLWASTSTKNPDYSDVKYVEALIGPDTVNTIPEDTLDAYRDHGNPASRLEDDLEESEDVFNNLPELNINIKQITQQLEDEGVEKFKNPFKELMDILEEHRKDALALPQDEMKEQLAADKKKRLQERLESVKNNEYNSRIWAKDPSLWKMDEESKKIIPEAMGWIDVAEEMAAVVSQIQHFAHEISDAGFTHVVHMGMGGSSLAPLLFERTFDAKNDGLDLTVLDTTDPQTIKQIENKVPLDTTLFIVASKSGTTAEPNAFGDYFYSKLKSKHGDNAGNHFVIITDPGTPLIDKATKRNYRRIFENFADIGGRYSALSYFGMVPAALMGVDIGDLLERALRMQHASRTTEDPAKNPSLKLGAAIGEFALQGRDKLTLVLPDSLATLGMWLEQLIAESTGKEGKGILPVAGEALLEPENYDNDRVFVHLYLKGNRTAETTTKLGKLSKAGNPVIEIELEQKEDVAQEFYRWEMAVAAAGAILGINPFNQPNVQGSKDATNRLLEKVKKEGALPEKTPVLKEGNIQFYGEGDADSAAELFQSFTDQAQTGDYIAIQAYLTENEKTQQQLQEFRTLLQERYQVATTIGYGPRFLHSTGQYHKGGPDTGLFIQLTAEDETTLHVPDTNYSFSVFKHAQAEGDLEALKDNDRRLIRIDLGSDISSGLKTLRRFVNQPASKAV